MKHYRGPHPLVHVVSTRPREGRRGRRLRALLRLTLLGGFVVGLYLLLKVLVPQLASLLDGLFAGAAGRVGEKMLGDE